MQSTDSQKLFRVNGYLKIVVSIKNVLFALCS